MRKIGYILIAFLPLMVSCRKSAPLQNTVINDSLFQVITINPDDINKEKPGKISEFSDQVEYIPLQTSDDFLIGEIGKLVVWNDLYYIWDNLSESILCFGQDGNFRYRISKQGEAPDEYFSISDFELNRENGNIIIYSAMGQAFYEYTAEAKLIKKTKVPFILSSFAAKGDWKYCYLGRLPNMDFYKDIFPDSYRYATLNNESVHNQQLEYKYDESFLKVPLPTNNFTSFGDTILLTEFLCPEVFWIDSVGTLNPRYRIKFTTDEYTPTFHKSVDLKRMNHEIEQGNLTRLYNAFYENKKYVFLNYARGLVGMAYVEKKDGSIHNPGYFLLDDFNQNTLPASIAFVDEEYMYKIGEPGLLIEKREKGNFSSYLNDVCAKVKEFDNPVIIKIRLK